MFSSNQFFIYERSNLRMVSGGPFSGTTVQGKNEFDDDIRSLSAELPPFRQQFGISLQQPSSNGAAGGQLIQIDWSRFGESVVSENWISFQNFMPYINNVPCRNQ